MQGVVEIVDVVAVAVVAAGVVVTDVAEIMVDSQNTHTQPADTT